MLAPPITGAIAGLTDVPTTLRLLAIVLPSLYYTGLVRDPRQEIAVQLLRRSQR